MDLGRWGQRKIQQISSRSKNLYEFLADVLEGERELVEQPETAKDAQARRFVSRDDLSTLERELESGRGGLSVDGLFDKLTPYFEAGFLLRRQGSAQDAEWRLSRMFILGQAFAPDDAAAAPEFPVPAMERLAVLKTRGRPILRRFGLDAVGRLSDSAAFLHKPSEDEAFLLLSDRARPWLLERVEAANRALARWAELPAPPPASGRGKLFE